MSLPLVDSLGRVYAVVNTTSAADDVFNAGLRYTKAGRLRCTSIGNVTNYSGGRALTSEGQLAQSTAGVITQHNAGWPCQANGKVRVAVDGTPQAQDAYIGGGIRVGSTAGIYITTAAFPYEIGFSNGFDAGFGV